MIDSNGSSGALDCVIDYQETHCEEDTVSSPLNLSLNSISGNCFTA